MRDADIRTGALLERLRARLAIEGKTCLAQKEN